MLVGGGGKGGSGGGASLDPMVWLISGVGGPRFGSEAASSSGSSFGARRLVVWPSSVWILGTGGNFPSSALRFQLRAGPCDEAEGLVAGAEGGESPVR
jgi:hypothetical protein